ncbi:MAG: rhodanese-like domain-containing protein [Dehalogenimonas sp.]
MRIRWLVAGLIIFGGLLPAASYWLFVGRIPDVTPVEARGMLIDSRTPTLLVDIRSSEDFNKSHLTGAINWPKPEIDALESNREIPGQFEEARLLLYCNSGIDSAKATQTLRRDFGIQAYNVAGGLEAWIGSIRGSDAPAFVSDDGKTVPAPYEESPVSEQAALAIAILIFKPSYMLLSAALIYLLWRYRSIEIRAISWGLAAFLAGEIFCAINIIFFNHADYLLELAHSYGMVVGFAFFAFAAVEIIDRHILGYSTRDSGCALAADCDPCRKENGVRCKVSQLAILASIGLLVLAFMPLTTDFISVSYNTTIFHSPFNYSHPVVYQMFETRFASAYAIILLGCSILALLIGRNGWRISKVLAAAGIGALGFAFLRLMVFHFYSNNLVWFEFWEETTELLFVFGMAIVLWMFRERLGKQAAA